MADWDLRQDGSRKGSGFFGALKRPDGRVSTEISVGAPINGQEAEFPSLVPTLTREEVQHLMDWQEGPLPDAIIQKAVKFAESRVAAGKPYFAQPGEQNFQQYPDIQREAVGSDVPLASSRKNVDPDALQRLLVQRRLGK